MPSAFFQFYVAEGYKSFMGPVSSTNGSDTNSICFRCTSCDLYCEVHSEKLYSHYILMPFHTSATRPIFPDSACLRAYPHDPPCPPFLRSRWGEFMMDQCGSSCAYILQNPFEQSEGAPLFSDPYPISQQTSIINTR